MESDAVATTNNGTRYNARQCSLWGVFIETAVTNTTTLTQGFSECSIQCIIPSVTMLRMMTTVSTTRAISLAKNDDDDDDDDNDDDDNCRRHDEAEAAVHPDVHISVALRTALLATIPSSTRL